MNGANLTDAVILPDQLTEANDISYATMPNGMKYEDWVSKGRPD